MVRKAVEQDERVKYMQHNKAKTQNATKSMMHSLRHAPIPTTGGGAEGQSGNTIHNNININGITGRGRDGGRDQFNHYDDYLSDDSEIDSDDVGLDDIYD